MTIKKRFLVSYLSAFIISIGSLFLILSVVFYVTLNKFPSMTEVYKMITTQRALTKDEETSFVALDRLVKKSPTLLEEPFSSDLQQTIQEIESKGLSVIIRKNQGFPYFSEGLVEKSLKAHAPDYEMNNFSPAGTLDNAGRLFHYIKLDFNYLDGSQGAFIILQRQSNLFEFFTKWGIWIILLIIAVAILSAWLINYRLGKTTIEPLEELELATKSVKEFSLYIENKKQLPERTISKEVRQLQQSFEEMWVELQKAEAARKRYEENRKELIANISHDLKTPITSIIGHVEGLQDGVANTPEKEQKYLNIIHTQGVNLNELIEELFLYSQLDSDAIQFHLVPLDFTTYLKHRVTDYPWDEKTRWTLEFNDQEHQVAIDSVQMNKVLLNLFQNSLKFRDPKKTFLELTFDLYTEDNQLVFTFTDNGRGIEADELKHIFRRFYRVDKSRTPTVKGSGLGLSIVKQIIEAHHGTIQIKSQFSVFTQVIIRLPLVKSDTE